MAKSELILLFYLFALHVAVRCMNHASVCMKMDAVSGIRCEGVYY